MIIAPPKCDWAKIAYKDKRVGYSWRCKACGHKGRGKSAPRCPCKKIEITDAGRAALENK